MVEEMAIIRNKKSKCHEDRSIVSSRRVAARVGYSA